MIWKIEKVSQSPYDCMRHARFTVRPSDARSRTYKANGFKIILSRYPELSRVIIISDPK